MSCQQCHGCALKSGAAANQEPNNRLKAIIAALGGVPFYCHESLGWTPDRDDYPAGFELALEVAVNREKFLKAGIPTEILDPPKGFRESLRICGGWRSTVQRLKSLGWFRDRNINLVRRCMAKSGVKDLDIGLEVPEKIRQVRLADLREKIEWFANEARESKTNIAWLFE